MNVSSNQLVTGTESKLVRSGPVYSSLKCLDCTHQLGDDIPKTLCIEYFKFCEGAPDVLYTWVQVNSAHEQWVNCFNREEGALVTMTVDRRTLTKTLSYSQIVALNPSSPVL